MRGVVLSKVIMRTISKEERVFTAVDCALSTIDTLQHMIAIVKFAVMTFDQQIQRRPNVV